jgi:F-type H+-transporting ATPase subunit gamma
MANLKEVRERISSVISTQQITKAMKMVSAAKFRRAQMAIVQIRPYSNRLEGMLSNILSNLDGDAATSFGDKRTVQSALLVVVTSNRGLCGAFNTNIIKAAQQSLLSPEMQQARANGKLSVLCIGKKGFEFFRRQKDLNMIADHVELFSKLNFESVKLVANDIMASFESKQYDHVVVCYGQFKNAATQEPTAVDFLPVSLNVEVPKEKGQKADIKADYIFMPDKVRLLEGRLILALLALDSKPVRKTSGWYVCSPALRALAHVQTRPFRYCPRTSGTFRSRGAVLGRVIY